MVLEKLSSSLKNTLKKIAGAVLVDEKLINELIKDLQKSLLHADVNVQLVFDLTQKIKERALKEKAPASITQKEHLINIVYQELVKFLGEEKSEIRLTRKKPFKIMLLGLFGSGKSTTCSKIAKFFQKRGKKIAMLQLDVYRPAAVDQLEQLGKKINITTFTDKKEKKPSKIYKKFEKEYSKYDILIIDTAGRDALSKDLIKEIKDLVKSIKPDERFLVISGDLGQAAQKQAETFNESCDVTGIIITKLEGTAKGGGALTGAVATKSPIKFIGTGEKIDDLEEFNPKAFVGRLLGMGDIEALLEKAKEAITEEKAEDLGKKFLKGEFNLIDLYEQMKAVKKMGPLSKIMDLIPGMGNLNLPKDVLETQEEKIKKWKFIMDSMNQEELERPDELLDSSRMERIAKGAGTTVREVRELLKQYRQSKKLIKMVKGKGGKTKDVNKLLKRFGGKLPPGFKL